MSAMEQSLRRALDAGNPADPSFRESIYAASERALERMLAAKPLDEASAHAQRVRLAETINRVEDDYYAFYREPAASEDEIFAPSDFDEPIDADLGARPEGGETGGMAPRPSGPEPEEPRVFVAPPPTDRDRAGTKDSVPPVSPAVLPADKRRPTRSRRGLAVALLVLLAALAVAGYFLYATVFPQSGASAAAAGDAASSVSNEGWIALFEGTQLSTIATPAGGRVEAVTAAGDRPAVRISSAGEGAEIEVAVGAGAVATLAGQTVRVELTVGSPDGQPREFGVRCLFGGESYCGRQRFTTTQSSEVFLLDMTVPPETREAGSIALDPGIGGQSKALDLYAVRTRIVAPV